VSYCCLPPHEIFFLAISWREQAASMNRISGVMVSVLISSAVDRGFECRSSQTKNYQIDVSFFSAKHAVLRRKNKYWLARNQDNVSECGEMTIHRLLCWGASTIKIQLRELIQNRADPIIISMEINLFSP